MHTSTHLHLATRLLIAVLAFFWSYSGATPSVHAQATVTADIYVSVQGVNTNPGTQSSPVRDLSRAYELVRDGGTILMTAGTYDMNRWSVTLAKRITLLGEGPTRTILRNPGTISLQTKGITIKNLKFTQAEGTVIALNSRTGDTLSGVYVENVHFVDIARGIDGVSETGRVSDVRLTSVLMDTVGGTGNAKAVEIQGDLVENVVIENSTFRNITSTDGLAIGLRLGVVEGRDTNIVVRNNTFENIAGNQGYAGTADATQGYETHAIQAYGRNILITRNTIRNFNPGPDHEPIYLKGRDSEISYNQIEPGSQNLSQGSQGNGDITIKGEGGASNNIIQNNTILSGNNRQALYILGKSTVQNNCIHKPNANSQMLRIYNVSDTDTNTIPIVRNNKIFQQSGAVMMVFSVYGVEILDNQFSFAQTGTIGDMTRLNNLGYVRISGNVVTGNATFTGCPTVGASTTPPPTTPSTCTNTLTSTASIPTGYGASYNPLTSAREYLVSVACGSGTTGTVTAGNGNPLTYVYNRGYYYSGTAWTPYTLTCASGALISGAWCPGRATASIPLPQNPTNVIAYTCQYTNSTWKCGCRDATCSTAYWQLQRVGR